MHLSSDTPDTKPLVMAAPAHGTPVMILAAMMVLVPALGFPNELMLQDTLKSAIAAFGILGAGFAFFYNRGRGHATVLWHGILWVPLTLSAYALVSMVWSHTFLAGVEAIRWFLISGLIWLGLNTITRETLPKIVWGVHIGLTLACLWVALQFWWDWSFFAQGAQPASTFINKNFFAEYAVSAMPYTLWLLATRRNTLWIGVIAANAGFNILGVLMTGTRSALVALLLLLAVLTVMMGRQHRTFAISSWTRLQKCLGVAAFFCVIIFGGSLPASNSQVLREPIGQTALERSVLRASSIASKEEYSTGSFSMRSVMWMATARMMLAHPLSGVGAGAWEVEIPLHQRVDTVLEHDYYAHNEPLQLLSEYGLIVGGICLAVLLAYLFHSAGTTWYLREPRKELAPQRIVALTSLGTLLLVSNAGFPLHLAGTGALFALGLALLTASDETKAGRGTLGISSVSMHPSQARLALGALACLFILAIHITVQAALAERKIVHALHLGWFLGKDLPPPGLSQAQRKQELLVNLRDGIAINPHYRRLTAVAAEQLTAAGDFENAIWVQESVLASRPHVPALWAGLALNYAQTGQHTKAWTAFEHVAKLKPHTLGTLALRVTLLSRAGRDDEARADLVASLDANQFDFGLLQTGYALGLKMKDRPLALRSLELFQATWPQHAADTFLRIGNLYADPADEQIEKAIAAYRRGLAAVPSADKANYRAQVPDRYRDQL